MWGIGEEGWSELWSGLIGSVVGAVAAALVALLVVWRTNKHQTKLATRAAEKQSELIDRQLEEQRKALDTQLRQQQESLARQLHEQRTEARRERERSAMADIVSGLTGLRAGAWHADFDQRPDMDLVAAGIHRWRLELGNSSTLGEELELWPGLLWEAHDYVRSCRRKHEPFIDRAVKLYIRHLDYLLEVCMKWSESESDEYGILMNEMMAFRLEFDEKRLKVEGRR